MAASRLMQNRPLTTECDAGAICRKRKMHIAIPTTGNIKDICDGASPCKMKRLARKSTIKKKVTFAADTKKHDGLLQTSQLFNDLVWWFFHHPGSIRTSGDLLFFLSSRTRLLPALINRVKDLIIRMSRARTTQMTPVLPRGGGRLLVLPRSKMGTIMLLLNLCSTTCNSLLQLYQRRLLSLAQKRPASAGSETPLSDKLSCNPASSKISITYQCRKENSNVNLNVVPKEVMV